MNINTLKEFIFIAVFSIDVFFNVYFLYKFKNIKNKNLNDLLIFICYIGFSVIKVLFLINLARLMINPASLIHNPKITYVGMDYAYIFSMYKNNLLNNYMGVSVILWLIIIFNYWKKNYIKN